MFKLFSEREKEFKEREKGLNERIQILQALYRSQFKENLDLVKEIAELKDQNWKTATENERLHKILISVSADGGAK